MGMLRTLRFVWNHPLNEGGRLAAVGRFARWQVASRVLGAPTLLPIGAGAVLVAGPGETGATGNYYCGLHEYPDMVFVLHALRPGDLFLDVGSNIGSYAVIAGAGAGARVIAVEPVPGVFARLRRNIAVNGLEGRVDARNVAVGESSGVLRMTSGHDTTNHVLTEGEAGVEGASVQVEVTTLDSIAPPGEARLMKIDVEGFEKPALRGASRLLREEGLLAVVVELNQSGRRYGVDDAEIDAVLRDAGFVPVNYDPRGRGLAVAPRYRERGNTLYARHGEALRARLREAAPVRVFGRAV